MQTDINAISRWCKDNGIRANTEKTKVMVFGSTQGLAELPDFQMYFDGSPLQHVMSYKYFGMTLDSQLNYNLYVNKVVASVSGNLKQFHRMRSFLNVKAALLVYKSMLLPLLEYGDVFLSAASLGNRKKLQVLQNKGLRCALNKGLETSSDSLHNEANLLKLKYRREQHLLNFMFNFSKDSAKLKYKPTTTMTTRSQAKKLFRIKKPNTEKYKKSFSYRGAQKWNALPATVQHSTDKGAFKREVGVWIAAKAHAAKDT